MTTSIGTLPWVDSKTLAGNKSFLVTLYSWAWQIYLWLKIGKYVSRLLPFNEVSNNIMQWLWIIASWASWFPRAPAVANVEKHFNILNQSAGGLSHNEETTTTIISFGDGKRICWSDNHSWGRLRLFLLLLFIHKNIFWYPYSRSHSNPTTRIPNSSSCSCSSRKSGSPRVQWISGTEQAIIDPLVLKWPNKF